MSMFNYAGAAQATSLLAPVSAANTAAATTGTGVDLIDYNAPLIITQHKGIGTGTLDGKIQDCDTVGGTYADVAGAVFTQSTTTADVKMLALNPKSCRRYVKYVGTIVTGPQIVGVSIAGVKKSV